MELRPWQRLVLDRALEHDAAGRLVWPVVVVTVPRQQGKSVLLAGLHLWRMHQTERWGEPQTIAHVAHVRTAATRLLQAGYDWVQGTERIADGWYVRKASGSERVTAPWGSSWELYSANSNAGVGGSFSQVTLDEAWAIPRHVFEDALRPTMRRRSNAQAWLVSTAGDSDSDLLMHYRQMALAGAAGVLLIEWSAEPDAAPDDPAVWRACTPWWDDDEEAKLWDAYRSMDRGAFRRQMLNQWVAKADHWLPDGAWSACRDDLEPDPAGEWHVGVEAQYQGHGHAVAIASEVEGRIVVRVSWHDTVHDVDTRLRALRESHTGALRVWAGASYDGYLTERVDGLVGNVEATGASQAFSDAIRRRVLAHDGDQLLAEHLFATVLSRRQDGWRVVGTKDGGNVYGAKAVMWAAAKALKAGPAAPVVHIRRAR